MKFANINIVLVCISFLVTSASAENLSLQQVLQRVVDHYPAIKSAAYQVEKASQENIKVESQLSWLLNSKAGYARETSLFGTATDRYNMGAGVNRSLDNGGLLGFNASIAKEDAADTFGPSIPNPSTKSRLDVNYRHKFAKGAGNPLYAEGMESAQAGELLALSDKLSLYDQLASQVIDLYLASATTQARINSIDKTIERALRLKKYIEDEFKLGLSEEKDVLQVDARLRINEADKISLQVAMQKQVISLNRLMGRAWDKPLLTDIKIEPLNLKSYNQLYQQSQSHSPALKRIDARLQLADSSIRSSRDKRKDDLDLVLYVGNEFNDGDTASGNLDESEIVGGISVEFNRGLDKSGFDAQLRQAHYDKGIALEDKKQILEDLQYNISSLLAEIKSSEQALNAFKNSVKAEDKKLKEAITRYEDGRIETDRIIDFESQLSVAELSLDLQSIELTRRYHQLNVIRGFIWKDVLLPEFVFDDKTLSGIQERSN
ncbi:MAG: TolC family protein [Gammaproteobacteria bacterium]|nr:TolC family protein [Gammaproteobacteria bacterium]